MWVDRKHQSGAREDQQGLFPSCCEWSNSNDNRIEPELCFATLGQLINAPPKGQTANVQAVFKMGRIRHRAVRGIERQQELYVNYNMSEQEF